MRILITGGAGFVGSNLAYCFKQEDPTAVITVLDNLKRRGSEINLALFKRLGIEFSHGDIRSFSELEDLRGTYDVFIEASAEPSVLAGLDGAPRHLLQTNLLGTLNCLEFAGKRAAALCQEIMGRKVLINEGPRTSPVDIPLYISDYSKAAHRFDWRPQRALRTIGEDIIGWIEANQTQLKPIMV